MQNTNKILVLGDAMEDIYHIGTSHRRSAEADVPIVTIESTKYMPGGAMNVKANLEELGIQVIDSTNFGPKKHRLILNDIQIARWDEDDYCTSGLHISEEPYSGVIISDYAKGSITPAVIQYISTHPHGPFFIDTKRNPADFSQLPGESYFFPNESEFLAYSREYNDLPHVIHKRGPLGMRYLSYGKVISEVSALCKNPVSVCGAGDSVIASFSTRLLECGNPACALAYANAAAAVVVSKPYTATASPAEIEEYLKLYEY